MGSCIEFFASNKQNSISLYYTLTPTNSLSSIRVSISGKGSERPVSFMGSVLVPEQLASHNLSSDEKIDVFREPIKLSLFN